MDPIKFIERSPKSVNHLYATDYIFYGFTPEQAWSIDKALFARWAYGIQKKCFESLKDDCSRRLALHDQNDYIDAINELRGMA